MQVTHAMRGMRRQLSAAAAAGALAVMGCTAELRESAQPSLNELVASVATLSGSATAAFQAGDRPVAAGGPTVTVTGIATTINGGSFQVAVNSATSFSRVVVAVDGLRGYYELNLPAAVTSVDLVIGVSQQAPATSLRFLYAGAVGSGPVGADAASTVRILAVATGDIQVSVSWDTPSDVDLHVTDPANEEVYFANTTSNSGGRLDLDSNAACSIDNVNNENIVWPTNLAPAGNYIVELVYWSACGVASTDYVVTVQIRGQAPRIFSGTLTGAGSASTKIPITTFAR